MFVFDQIRFASRAMRPISMSLISSGKSTPWKDLAKLFLAQNRYPLASSKGEGYSLSWTCRTSSPSIMSVLFIIDYQAPL